MCKRLFLIKYTMIPSFISQEIDHHRWADLRLACQLARAQLQLSSPYFLTFYPKPWIKEIGLLLSPYQSTSQKNSFLKSQCHSIGSLYVG